MLAIGVSSLRGALATKQSILSLRGDMDCFAEPVIGRRFAPTRWLAMTAEYRRPLLRRLRRFPEHPRRRREAARGAVGDLDLVFPRQPEGAGDHVLHEGIGTIHRAALHRDIAAVPELIDVVLDAPVDPRLAHQIGAHL